MLNLLKFKPTGATEDESGQASYGRYGAGYIYWSNQESFMTPGTYARR